MQQTEVDVVVIGGGPAGLQAALMLGRSRRTVTLVDGGRPRTAPAGAVHNLFGREGVAPGSLLADGRADAARYGVETVAGEVVDARQAGPRWSVELADGSIRDARAIVLATGVVEDLPRIDGLAELWGRDVVSCPYCHGWEARDRPVAVLGSGARAWRQLLLLRRFTEDLVLLSNGAPGLEDAQLRHLRRVGVAIHEDTVVRVCADRGRLTGVELRSGQPLPREVLFAVTTRRQHSDLASRLGCATLDDGPMTGAVWTDASGHTSIPGVWAAGSTTRHDLTVIGSAGHASTVAIAVDTALLEEEVREQAATDRRARPPSPGL